MGQQKDWQDMWRGLGAAVIVLLVFAAACLPGIAHAETTVLQLTTEQLPPLNMSDDDGKTVHGVAADRVHELMRRTGIGYNVQMMSWNRAIELARRQSDTCAFSTVRTSEREASFKWVGPLAKGDWVLFGPKNKVGKVTSLEQIKGARIGGYLGDAAGRYLSDSGYEVVVSYSDEATLKNLLAGRLDYWVSTRKAAQAMVARHHADMQVAELFHIRSVDYYLACNLRTNDAVISSLRAALKQISSDGTFDRIEAKY
jgi:polar amino acid transport system substrate-binding protein